nr:hypothetical protein [Bidens alba var. radiata]
MMDLLIHLPCRKVMNIFEKRFLRRLSSGSPQTMIEGAKSFSGEEDEHLLRLFCWERWDRKSWHVRPLSQGLKGMPRMLGMKLIPNAVKKASEAGGYFRPKGAKGDPIKNK